MFKHIFDNIEGINTLPIVVLIIFFTVFVILVLWALTIDKKTVSYLSRLPLNNDEIKISNNGGNING